MSIEPGFPRVSPGLARVGRAMIAFRHFLACSRPPHRRQSCESKENYYEQATALASAKSSSAIDIDAIAALETDSLQLHSYAAQEGDRQMVAELHAVFRHLEVRWQLFSESLSKFCDPEAMLANCTDDVTWSTANGEIIRGKNSELLALLQSLITRKLSLEVEIDRITRITPSGALDLTLEKSGNCRWLTDIELSKATTTLNLLLSSPETCASGSASEGKPLMILESDLYTLRNAEGAKVERGERVVLWEQHNATWYIRGYLSCPPDDFKRDQCVHCNMVPSMAR